MRVVIRRSSIWSGLLLLCGRGTLFPHARSSDSRFPLGSRWPEGLIKKRFEPVVHIWRQEEVQSGWLNALTRKKQPSGPDQLACPRIGRDIGLAVLMRPSLSQH